MLEKLASVQFCFRWVSSCSLGWLSYSGWIPKINWIKRFMETMIMAPSPFSSRAPCNTEQMEQYTRAAMSAMYILYTNVLSIHNMIVFFIYSRYNSPLIYMIIFAPDNIFPGFRQLAKSIRFD